MAEAVYDATVVFCRRFLGRDRRMTDQMVQAAYLLKRQIESQGRTFLREGGFTENLYRRRSDLTGGAVYHENRRLVAAGRRAECGVSGRSRLVPVRKCVWP